MSSSALLFPDSPQNPRHTPGPRPPADRGKRLQAVPPVPQDEPEPPPVNRGDLISVLETAELLNQSYHQIYKLVKAGHFGQPVIFGLSGRRGMQVRRREVEAFVQRGGVGGGQ